MPNESDLPSRPPRRRLPLRYVLGVAAALFAAPVLVWLTWGWIEAARLNRTLDALDARHEPLDPTEFEARPTTEEQRQASHLYAQAGRLSDERPIMPQQAAALAHTIEMLCAPDADPLARSAQSRLLLDFEQNYAPALDLLERASQLDAKGWADGDRPQRHSIQEMRPLMLVRANVVRIARLACTGDGDGAARALLATLRLRHVWSGIIGPIAMQTSHGLQSLLTNSTPSPALLQRIQTEYVTAADENVFSTWMLRERALWLSFTMPGVFSDLEGGSASRRMTPLEAVARRLVRPLRDQRLVEELDEFDAAMAVAKQPWPAKLDAVAEFGKTRQAQRSPSQRPGIIEGLTRPLGAHMAANALTGYINVMTETLARNRISAAAIAVARYRRDHTGACPETLQQLGAAYLPAPSIDPYSGTELKYRYDASGYRVYSVGANRKDDGGVWEQHSDLQLSRRGNPLDIGIEVRSIPARKAN